MYSLACLYTCAYKHLVYMYIHMYADHYNCIQNKQCKGKAVPAAGAADSRWTDLAGGGGPSGTYLQWL